MWLDFLKPKNTSSLEEHYEKQAYQKQKLEQAEEKGKERAKTEAKQEKQEVRTGKKVKSGFDKFQTFAENFAKNQQKQSKQSSMFGDLSFGGINGKNNGLNKKDRKRI